MNNVEFHINTQTSVLWVWIDRRKMEFALRVLLSNALKNTYRFGKISINISVVRSNGKAYCCLLYTSMYRLKKENIAKGGELMARNDELLRSVDALSVKNREIQQMLVNKIRETDNWNRDNEVEREDLKKRLEEMEKLHNSFFVETIRCV